MPLPGLYAARDDRGWLAVPRLVRGPSVSPAMASLQPAADGAPTPEPLAGVAALLGDAPDALAWAPLGCFAPLPAQPGAPEGLRIAYAAVSERAASNSPVFACLLSAAYSGRILGLKTPALLAGVKLRSTGSVVAVAEQTLDRLNARYGWGLIPRREVVGDEAAGPRELIILDGTRPGVYSSLRAGEKPALAAAGDWLLFGSNADVLRGFLDRAGGPAEAGGTEPAPRWLAAVRTEAAGGLWVDLDATGQALRKVLAVYSLVLMAQNTEDSSRARRQMEEARRWIDAVRPLQQFAAWASADAADVKVGFRLGPRFGPQSHASVGEGGLRKGEGEP